MKKGFRVAVVGLGGMGRRHLQAIQMAGMEIAAVCDLSESAIPPAMELCQSAPRTYTHWQKLLEQEAARLDVLVVATNGPSHAEITRAAAQLKVSYILCEKPMTTSGQQAREMAFACQRSGSRLAINLSRRYADRYVRLKQALKQGVIGDIHHVNVVGGAGGLGCIGSHWFDFVAWLVDTWAVWVIGSVDVNPVPNVRGEQFFDPGGRGMIGYANGMIATFELSGEVPTTPLVQIIGTQGFLEFDEWSPPCGGQAAIFARPEKARHTLKTRFVQPERVEFEAGQPMDVVLLSRLCLEDLVGENHEDTLAGGIAAVDIVMAFHLSAQRDWQKVPLPLSGADLLLNVPIT